MKGTSGACQVPSSRFWFARKASRPTRAPVTRACPDGITPRSTLVHGAVDRGAKHGPRCLAAVDSAAAVSAYILAQPLLAERLGLVPAPSSGEGETGASARDRGPQDTASLVGLSVRELSGGRINYVWRVDGPGGSVVLKYTPPFVRSIGPSFQLAQSRLRAEALAHAAAHAACPAHVPALLYHDPGASVLVSELLGQPPQSPRVKLVDALAAAVDAAASAAGASPAPPPAPPHELNSARPGAGPAEAAPAEAEAAPPPHLARLSADLASLLGAYLLRKSRYALPYEQYNAVVRSLSECNAEVVAANADVVFRDPWDAACARNRVPAGLEAEVAALRSDPAVRAEVQRLLHLYLNSRETLIHNDLTTGNILVPRADTLPNPWAGHDSTQGAASATPAPPAAWDAAATSSGTGSRGRGNRGPETPHHSDVGDQRMDHAVQSDCAGSNGANGQGEQLSSARGSGSAASSTHLIDWEFATYGPMAYDIGSLLGNLLLSYCAMCGDVRGHLEQRQQEGQRANAATINAAAAAAGQVQGVGVTSGARGTAGDASGAAARRAWLLGCIVEVWEGLEAQLSVNAPAADTQDVPSAACSNGGRGAEADGVASRPGDPEFARQLLADSLGYAGCVVARLVWGMHHYPALECIACPARRAACQRLALRLAGSLLRPGQRMALGWEQAGAGGAGGKHDAGGSGGAAGGVRRLVHDAACWALEVDACA